MTRYTNAYNKLTYWIDGETVMFGLPECQKKSNFTVEDIEAMVKEGKMIPISESTNDFKARVLAAHDASQTYNLRFLAFIEHVGRSAWGDNMIKRNARYMSWISDRKEEYKKAHPGMVPNDSIANQDHFTDFIINGEWIK